ncbi:MAG TPA: hypothetical protein VMJ64_15950 [Anaerolineales bacterium]|nr:hypothetical protein [Anaerolineales bacterium]
MRPARRPRLPSGSSFALHIFVVALIARLIPVFLTRHIGIGLDDMFQYDMLARSLALGHGYRWYALADLAKMAPYLRLSPVALTMDPLGVRTTFRAPLYPLFLSLVYGVSGINDGRFVAARLAQALLGAMLAPLTYVVANQVRLPSNGDDAGLGAARLAAWAVALYPVLVLFPLALATENLFFLLLLASLSVLLALARARSTRARIGLSLLAGILLGLTALTRSVIIPFAALAALWVWFMLRLRLAALVLAIAFLFTVLPWIIRNSLMEGRLTGIETSMGYNLYVGYHPESTGTFIYGPSLDLLSIMDDKVRDQYGTQRALSFIRQDPARFPYLVLRRLGYFFDLELRGFTYFYTNNFLGHIALPFLALVLLVLALPFTILSLSAAFGWTQISFRPEGCLLLLLFAAYLFPHVFILSEDRFHLALVPLMAIPAAAFWARGFAPFEARRPWVIAISILIAACLLANWAFELRMDGATLLNMLGPGGNQLYLTY